MVKSSGDFAAFEAAIAADDMHGAEAHIHSIKGITGNLSLTALFEASAVLNNQLRDGSYDHAALVRYREAYPITIGFIDILIAQMED